jgi:hypothetical protein
MIGDFVKFCKLSYQIMESSWKSLAVSQGAGASTVLGKVSQWFIKVRSDKKNFPLCRTDFRPLPVLFLTGTSLRIGLLSLAITTSSPVNAF